VTAWGAHTLYKGTRLIVDFGTAVTFDFLSARGEYLGGFIFPGLGVSAESLSQCALLPQRITLSNAPTKQGIPRTTRESVCRGIQEGFALMVGAFARKYYRGNKIVITGGDAPLISKYLNFPYTHDPLLTLRGLSLLKTT